jgi:AraC-like DNA-binding protein
VRRGKPYSVPQGWSAALRGFCELAAGLNCDGRAILAMYDIAENATLPPGYAVPTVSLFGVMRELSLQAGVPGIALQLLERQTYQILGSMGDIAKKGSNLGQALNLIAAVLHTRGTGYVSAIELGEDIAVIRYRSILPAGPVQDVQLDYNIGAAVLAIRHLIGSDWKPEAVELTRARPASVADWEHYFQCPVRFGAEQAFILFSAQDMRKPLISSGSMKEPEPGVLESVPIDFVQFVDREIIRELSLGKTDLATVAVSLGVTARTVQRRLADVGTSFQQRVDEVRKNWALHYLLESQMSLTNLTQMLGYDDASTFSRTFRRWFGVSPRAWRKEMQLGA